MEKYTISNGIAVRYAVFGKGTKTILLIHGYLESMEVWDNFAGILGKTHRIVTIDLPGSGMSDWGNREVISMDFMADVTADILTKAEIEKCTVVGHSMGGYVALALAARNGEIVEKLVLLHSSPNEDTEEKRANRLREIGFIEAGKKELLASINPEKGFAKANTTRCMDLIEELQEQVMMTDDRAIIATLRGMMERENRCDFFAEMKQRRLMIFGTDDNFIPAESAQAMIDKYSGVDHLWVEKAGHMSFAEHPDIVAANLSQFVAL